MEKAVAEVKWDSWLNALEKSRDMRCVTGMNVSLSRPVAAEVEANGGASRAARIREVRRILAEACALERERGPGAALDHNHPMNQMLERAIVRMREREKEETLLPRHPSRPQPWHPSPRVLPVREAHPGNKAPTIGQQKHCLDRAIPERNVPS